MGLGYVGLRLAVAFGRLGRVTGYDADPDRIRKLRDGVDCTGEVGSDELADADVRYVDEPTPLSECDFIVVAVPTPVDEARTPDLGPLTRASREIGGNLGRGAIVVVESTVFPGATEELCVPILEEGSGLKAGTDFGVGYSPERINPGDREHDLASIVKVVAASDEGTLDTMRSVYGSVVPAGLYTAPSIKVAEAAKVTENIQRDVNIGLVNELARVFDRLDIDSGDVLEAAGTKWNFLSFSPGLVGGHCVSVDPYYLAHKAESAGYHPELILAGRRVNDQMGKFVGEQLVKVMIRQGAAIRDSTVTVLGLTFKENVRDLRNTRVVDIVRELESYGIAVQVNDPLALPAEAQSAYGIELRPVETLRPAQAVVLATPHEQYLQDGWGLVRRLLEGGTGVVADVRRVLDRATAPEGVTVWRL